MDGYSSHINLAISEFCCNNDIILYCFPHHASHIIQPLDISCLWSTKKLWNNSILELQAKFNQSVTRSNFFPVFDKAWEGAKLNPRNVISGFRKAGLVPWNPDALDYTRIVDEEAAARDFNASRTGMTADVKLGITMAIKAFESKIEEEKKILFEKRFKDGWVPMGYTI